MVVVVQVDQIMEEVVEVVLVLLEEMVLQQ
jgi:hypothetical protein